MDSTQLCERVRASLKSCPLWEFALDFYRRDGVEAACLQLQDEGGADVCELLWICWLERHGLTPGDDCAASLDEVRRWQREMTRPLRHQRRLLKASAEHSASLAELRATLKRAELLAEREALFILQRLSESGRGIRHFEAGDLPLVERLAHGLPQHKETHLSALKSLEACLDREYPPR